MLEGTAKCPFCGRLYKWYAHTVADQSACPRCVAEAERAVEDQRPWPGWEGTYWPPKRLYNMVACR